MVRFLALAVMVGLLAAPAAAETGEVDLRALVMAGDIAPVEAALKAAEAADQASGGEPDAERALFELFTDTQPEIAGFTERWLALQPDDALALTARGWHLYALGWNVRGNATVRNVYPDAIAAMMEFHTQALELADKATGADPGLIAASDLKLMLTTTLGNPEIIPVELERVMAAHPNRGTLMRAMATLAPQWGGSPAQVKLLCERYVPMIKSVADYDMQVCAIDAVYSGNFWDGNQRDEAHQLLQLMPNPILDYARLQDALSGLGPPQQRLKILETLKAKRALDIAEAYALDNARAEIASGLNEQVEWKIAVANAVKSRRVDADRDPYDPLVVTNYVGTAMDAEGNLGTVADANDLIARLKRLLAQVPYSARAWQLLGELTGRDVAFGVVDLDAIAEAEPYFIDAAVYSNYDYDMVWALVSGKAWAIIDPTNVMNARDISTLPANELQRLDEVVHCPLIRQLMILQRVCRHNHIADDRCGEFPGGQFPVVARLYKVNARGACQDEIMRDPADPAYLGYSPIKIDFPPAP